MNLESSWWMAVSFIDGWYSLKLKNRFSYHWERRHIDGLIFRHDNAPHKKWESISSFPKHFHNENEENVVESYIDEKPENGLRSFLCFVKEKISS